MAEFTETNDGATYHETVNAINFLASAVEKFQDSEEEIFKFLIQISSISGNFLPYEPKDEEENKDMLSTSLSFLVQHLSKHYQKKLKQIFSQYYNVNKLVDDNHVAEISHLQKGAVLRACWLIEKLKILCGCKYVTTMLENISTRCMENLMQFHLKFFANPFQEIDSFENTFKKFIIDVETLSLDVLKILSLSGVGGKTQIASILIDSMLNKIQNEILILVNSISETVNQNPDSRTSSSESNNDVNIDFANDQNRNSNNALSARKLSCFSTFLRHIMHLEKTLNSYKIPKIISGESDGSTKTRQKSVLKHPGLPDVVMTSDRPSSARVVKSTASYNHWKWQECITELKGDLSKSMANAFREFVDDNLKQAKEEYFDENKHKISTVSSNESWFGMQKEFCPKLCIQCYAEVLQLCESLLPLAVLGSQYKPLIQVCLAYEESIGKFFKSMKMFLNDLIEDVPEKCPIKNLCIVLATCENVCMVLEVCGRSIQGDEERFPFQGIYQTYLDIGTKVKGVVVHFLVSNITNNMLHDAVSHNWNDHRDFNEGDSCSHSIKAWNLELTRIWDELSSTVSDHSKNKIFSQVLLKSLTCLSNRYAIIKPSYNRTKQIRRDVLSIFLIVQNFIWHLQSNPARVFPADIGLFDESESKACFQIHSHCQNLLTTLVFLASPISYLSNGLNNSDADEDNVLVSNWLHEISPALFLKSWNASLFSMSDISVMHCALKMISLHKSKQLDNTLFSLLVKDQFLTLEIFGKQARYFAKEQVSGLQQKLLTIFSCSNFIIWNNQLFAKCVSLIIGNNSRTLLNKSFNDKLSDDNIWIEFTRNSLNKLIETSLQRTVEYCVNYTWTNMGSEIMSLMPDSLQMELLNLNERMASVLENDYENCILLCLILLTQELVCILHALPLWMINVFSGIDKKLEKSASKQTFGSYGAHTVISVLQHKLNDVAVLEKELGLNIRKDAALMLKKLANLFENLCANNEVPKGDENLKRILLQSLGDAKEISKEVFAAESLNEDISYDKNLYEECEQFMQSLYQNTNKENVDVVEALESIRDILVNVSPNIKTQNNFGTVLPEPAQHDKACFNPLLSFTKIGDENFDQEVISNFDFEWDRLVISHVLNTQSTAITTLVKNRWDMQENAFLQDDEISPVNNVKNILSIK